MPTLPSLPGALGSSLLDAVRSAGPTAGLAQPGASSAPTGAPTVGKSDPAQSTTARTLAQAKRLPGGGWSVPGSGPMSDAAFRQMIERSVSVDMNYVGIEDLKPFLDKAGIQFSAAGGQFRVTGLGSPAGGVSIAPSTPAAPLAPAAPTSGSAGRPAGGGGGGGVSLGGGSAGRQQGPSAGWGGGGGNGGTTTIVPGGSGVPGVTSIDPTKPLGLDPSKGGPAGFQAGSFGAPGTFGSPGSILQGLNKDSSLNDVIMNIVKRQEGNRDAALATYGGALKTAENDPVLQGSRGRALDVLANPFSLNDTTVSRILGQQADVIGQNTQRAKVASADRAAAAGAGRGGLQAAQQDRFDINAVKSLGDAQRGLLVEQATRTPKELQASLASAGDFGARDVAQRTGIATGAADSIYGQTSIMGDALLSGVLMGGGAPKFNINEFQQGYALGPNTVARGF